MNIYSALNIYKHYSGLLGYVGEQTRNSAPLEAYILASLKIIYYLDISMLILICWFLKECSTVF